MPSTARKTLASLLIALHAAIMLCGPGLHAAPGLGHFGTSGVASKLDNTPELSAAVAAPGEHCPLCDFFAQGQLPLEQATLAVHRLVDPVEPDSLPISLPRPLILSAQSRAPPRIDARIVMPTTSESNLVLA